MVMGWAQQVMVMCLVATRVTGMGWAHRVTVMGWAAQAMVMG
jgi:hypothetical protein